MAAAAEWWDPPAQMRERLPVCGHTPFVRDRPTPFLQQGDELIKCQECGVAQSATTNARDGVPSESLAWGDARCIRRLTFSKKPQKVLLLFTVMSCDAGGSSYEL